MAHQQFAQHPWWNQPGGWKHLLNNLRLIVYAEVPPHVEYSFTAKGRQIQPVMMALDQVDSEWLEQDAYI
uniref:winged helix-turn-helix transcriptional regulator n=1 Tax=Petrachloros mirabilis TaxID=2918835 RepID=UPI003B845A2C